MNGCKNTNKDLLAIIIFGLGVLAFFHKILFSQESLYGADVVLYFYPLKKFIRDQLLAAGTLPFWNMYQFSGTPLIANIQASLFYPLGFLYYVLLPEKAYGYSTILHCGLSSLFMYGFMRALSVCPLAGFVSAVVFTLNGFFMGHLYAGHLTFVQNYIWIPLIFYLMVRFEQKRRLFYAVVGGLILGIQILGGFPQLAFYTIFSSCLYLLFSSLLSLRKSGCKNVSITLLGIAVFLLIGFCVAAVQILPTLEFTMLSTRAGGVSYEMATYDSLSPKEVLAFLIPDIFGNAVDGTYWRSSETWHFWETCGYVGMMPLVLAFVKTKGSELRVIKAFFVTLVGFTVFLALGKHNPLYPLIYRLPGFHSFRIPAQIIFLFVFGMATLAGIGVHQIREAGWRFNRGSLFPLAAIGSLLCLFLVAVHLYPFQFFFQLFRNFSEGSVTHANLMDLYERVSLSVDRSALFFFGSLLVLLASRYKTWVRRSMSSLVALIVVADLFLFGAQFIRTGAFWGTSEKERASKDLPRTPVEGRVVTTEGLFRVNDSLHYQFPSVLGYDPLILGRYVHFVFSSQDYPRDDHVVNLKYIAHPESKLLKLLHVKKVVTDRSVRDSENDIPYATIVGNFVIRDSEAILPFMKSDQFDPQQVVALETAWRGEGPSQASVEPLVGSCSVTSYGSEAISIRASLSRPGYLVLSEIYYPGWHATVNGKGVDILRGNYLFRVVPLEAGDHDVRMEFISWPFRIGALISLFGLVVSFGIIVSQRRSDKPKSAASY